MRSGTGKLSADVSLKPSKNVLRLLGTDAGMLPVNRVISVSIHSHHFQTLPGCTKVPLVNSFPLFFIFQVGDLDGSFGLLIDLYFFPSLRDREEDTFTSVDDLLQLLPDPGFIVGKGSRSL